ncbi:phosphopantothenoylcysteine decarboxylase [Babesia ovis]|uniref:Phosphopantothenoylcysteine decarboxylase n=1 Tax=Babesia ovis TaxID=5869 RepID=A0A9W5WW38_BABOV|nr:phosphopantothenoylcysteine decarboxylase [Babesia ovis]
MSLAVEKRILIGVTGSVAAIKIPDIITELRRHGKENNHRLEIRILATSIAIEQFGSYLRVEDVELYTDKHIIAPYTRGDPILHIELRRWADIFVICPLDCNTLAKLANGLCDNLLTDVARCWDFNKPIWVYPCMNTFMYEHPITAEQTARLESFGIKVVPPIVKKIICGDYGRGGLPPPEEIGTDIYNTLFKETKREINRSIRELERNRMKHEREETVLMQKLRTDAKRGRMQELRITAKELVRTRKMATQYCKMKAQMNAILSQLQSAHSTNMLSNSLKNVNKIISKVSHKNDAAEFQKLMNSLGRESDIINLKLDLMTESMDNAFNDVDSGEEEDMIISQILEELGIEGSEAMPSVNNVDLRSQHTQKKPVKQHAMFAPAEGGSVPSESPGNRETSTGEGHTYDVEDD